MRSIVSLPFTKVTKAGAGVLEVQEADLPIKEPSQGAQFGSLDTSHWSEYGSGQTKLRAKQPLGKVTLGPNKPSGDGNLWSCQRLHQPNFCPRQTACWPKLGS